MKQMLKLIRSFASYQLVMVRDYRCFFSLDGAPRIILALLFFVHQGAIAAGCEHSVIGFATCIQIAEQGSSPAQLLVGLRYLTGTNGASKDAARAELWLLRAASAGEVDAESLLGQEYYSGETLPQDYKKSFFWDERAAKNGDKDSQRRLADDYVEGNGTAKNPVKGFELFKEFASTGDLTSMLKLASMYDIGIGTHASQKDAQAWYRNVYEHGDGRAGPWLAENLVRGLGVQKNIDEAYLILSTSSQTNCEAARVLSHWQIIGLERKSDPENAFSLLKTWAGKDCDPAKLALASLYGAGIGVPQSYQKAREIYERLYFAPNQTPVVKMLSGRELAVIYYNGLGMVEDANRAFQVKEVILEIEKRRKEETGTAEILDSMTDFGEHSDKPSGSRGWQQPSIENSYITARVAQDVSCKASRVYSPMERSGTKQSRAMDMIAYVDPSSGWNDDFIKTTIDDASQALARCGILMRRVTMVGAQDGSAASTCTGVAARDVRWVAKVYFKKAEKSPAWANTDNMAISLPYAGPPGSKFVLTHEIGHVLGLRHPADFVPGPMQYDLLGNNSFTAEQCTFMRGASSLIPIDPAGRRPFLPANEPPFANITGAVRTQKAKYDQLYQDLDGEPRAFAEIFEYIHSSDDPERPGDAYYEVGKRLNIPLGRVFGIAQIAYDWSIEDGWVSRTSKFEDRPGVSNPRILSDLDVAFGPYRRRLEGRVFSIIARDPNRSYFDPAKRLDNLTPGHYYDPKSIGLFNTGFGPDKPTGIFWRIVGGDLLLFDADARYKGDYFFIGVDKDFVKTYDQSSISDLKKNKKFVGGIYGYDRDVVAGSVDDPRPTSLLKVGSYGALTPHEIPGGTAITPGKAWLMIMQGWYTPNVAPAIFAAMDDEKVGLPFAHTLGYAGLSETVEGDDAGGRRFKQWVDAAGPPKEKPVIVYCHHKNCWLSYNLALRFIALGYKNVYWMRDGLEGWLSMGLPLEYVSASD